MLSKEPICVKQLKGAQINQPSEKTVVPSFWICNIGSNSTKANYIGYIYIKTKAFLKAIDLRVNITAADQTTET